LLERDRADEAGKSLMKLRGASDIMEVQAELDEIHANIIWHKENSITSAKVFIQDKALWARLWRAWALSFLQQMSGAGGIRYYLPTNFVAAGTSKNLSLLASGIDGTVQVGCTIAAMFFFDRIGRRHSLGIGAVIMAFCLMVSAHTCHVCNPYLLIHHANVIFHTDQWRSAAGLPQPGQPVCQLRQHLLHLLLHSWL
jgi:hypothetical protein